MFSGDICENCSSLSTQLYEAKQQIDYLNKIVDRIERQNRELSKIVVDNELED